MTITYYAERFVNIVACASGPFAIHRLRCPGSNMTSYQPAQPSLLTKAAVHKLAESIASQVGWEPGGDIHAIVDQLGGCVEIEDTLLSDPEHTGSLYVDGPRKFRIIVPSHTSPERDRFTIAHEFGHFILHYLWMRKKDPNYPKKVVAYRRGSERIEWEANWFAGAFLMPADTFRYRYDAEDGDLWQIADYFKVSTKAAEIRAKDLGLVG